MVTGSGAEKAEPPEAARSLDSVVDIGAVSLARTGKYGDLGAELGQRISANMRQRHPPKPPVVTSATELEWNAEESATCKPDIQLTNSRRPDSLPTEFSRNTIIPFGVTFRRRGVFLVQALCRLSRGAPVRR